MLNGLPAPLLKIAEVQENAIDRRRDKVTLGLCQTYCRVPTSGGT